MSAGNQESPSSTARASSPLPSTARFLASLRQWTPSLMVALAFRQVNLFGADRCGRKSIARCLNDLASAHPSFRTTELAALFAIGHVGYRCIGCCSAAARDRACLRNCTFVLIPATSKSRTSRATSSSMDILSGLENGMGKITERNRNDPASQFRAVGSYDSDRSATPRWLCSLGDRQFRVCRRPARRRRDRSVDYSSPRRQHLRVRGR
jgi:hypothetical protein